MMNKTLEAQNIIAEGGCGENGMGYAVCSSSQEANKSWPFRVKLTTDNIRWDSLKISPSQEFEAYILANLDEASRKLLDAYIPVEIHIIDVDTRETYKANLSKKESFWFEPLPDVGQKKQNFCCHKLTEKAKKEFAYSVEPFRHIAQKRNLSYDQEIGLRWSGSRSEINFYFSIVHAPRFDSQSFRI